MMAWKNAIMYISGLKAGCVQLFKSSSLYLLKVLFIFDLSPSGGSVTILSDFYRIPSGNLSVG